MPTQLKSRLNSPTRRPRLAHRLWALALLSVAFAALAATSAFAADANPAATASSGHGSRSISSAAAFAFPPTSQCVSGGRLTVPLHKIQGVKWSRAVVRINGTKLSTVQLSQKAVQISGLSESSISVSISLQTNDRRSVTGTRQYRACTTPPPPQPPVVDNGGNSNTGGGTSNPGHGDTVPPPGAPQPGHYYGSAPQNRSAGHIEFFVSPTGNLQDVQIEETLEACAPVKTIFDHFEMAEVAVAGDGSFSATGHQNGVVEGVAATFTYVLSGNLGEKTASGSVREDVTFNNGTAYSCSTNSQTWTATRDATQSPQLLPAQPGHYYGSAPQNRSAGHIEFFVSPTGNLQDVQIEETALACSPAKTLFDHFEMAEVAVLADGSFSATGSQTEVIEGVSANVTYTLSGHVHGAGSDGRPRISGSVREDLTFDNGTSYSCTTGSHFWNATRDATQSPQLLPAQQGHYFGSAPQNRSAGHIEFDVPAGGNLQNVKIEETALACTPKKTVFSHFEMAEVDVIADGSFAKTTHGTAMIEGTTAAITYTLSGHVHGAGSDGKPRVSGSVREDVTFNNGTAYSCTTGSHFWNAAREGS
jgi:hypothetical protein